MSGIEEILVRFHGEHQATRDLLNQVLENQEKMMAVQADIDMAVAQINATVTAIQAAIAGLPAGVSTAALDTAIGQLAAETAALTAATTPPPPAAAPHVANPF